MIARIRVAGEITQIRYGRDVLVEALIVGAGVIGTVYGAHLAAAGHEVRVLSHGLRTDEVAAGGLSARDVIDGRRVDAEAAVVPDASGSYDIALVAVQRDQLASACTRLAILAGAPAIVFLGNNPAGRPGITSDIPGDVYLGFPGVGGVMTGGTADYVRIRQQPTALQQAADPRLAELEAALAGRGFSVQRVTDMDGWLVYHAAFVACIAAALYRCGTDPVRLAADRATLTLMCHAITQAFAALRAQGTAGLPRNLAILHSPPLTALAVRYWARTMRSPMGELCFAAHSRHAEAEMRALGHDVTARVTNSPALTELLNDRPAQTEVGGNDPPALERGGSV
jgi:2-dehydropantoate 2-reductase